VLLLVTWKQWKGPIKDKGTMANTIMYLLVFLVLLWLPCDAVRFPSKNYLQTNNSANFTEGISLQTNLNTYLNRGYVSDIQHVPPLGYRSTSNFQNLSRNYGQTAKENPFLNYKKDAEDDRFLNHRETLKVSHRSLRQTTSQEDSNLPLGHISNIYGNLPPSRNQENKEAIGRQILYKRDKFGVPESLRVDSPLSYRQSGSEYKFSSDKDNPAVKHLQNNYQNLNYRQPSQDDLSYDTRQRAVGVEERSEQAEERRLGGPYHMKMSSEEQELMLLDALHHKTNSTSRGFEATLADMLGKSESVHIMFQYNTS
jgi:hypothetical protein